VCASCGHFPGSQGSRDRGARWKGGEIPTVKGRPAEEQKLLSPEGGRVGTGTGSLPGRPQVWNPTVCLWELIRVESGNREVGCRGKNLSHQSDT
jgi:hypothetical protein